MVVFDGSDVMTKAAEVTETVISCGGNVIGNMMYWVGVFDVENLTQEEMLAEEGWVYLSMLVVTFPLSLGQDGVE